MKRNLLGIYFLLLAVSVAFSQTYENPESIVYDSVGDRYFISNKGGNTILQLDAAENLTNFVTSGLFEPKGLLIIGDTLLISVNSTSIQGFLLSDASRALNVVIAGATFMNDATMDGNGNLYISDSDKAAIYKLSLETEEYSTLISSGISPNGLLYDEENDALLICNWGSNAKIQSYDLIDSTLSDLVTTPFSNLDGLARDNCGNIYVSSWGSNSVYVYDKMFTYPSLVASSGHSGPADISINQKTQTLAIPNFNANTIKLVDLNMGCVKVGNLLPVDNAIVLLPSINLDWEDMTGVDNYDVEYSIDSTFKDNVIMLNTNSSDTIIEGLDVDKRYYWRVKPNGGENKNVFNTPWRFTTTNFSGTSDNFENDGIKIYPNPAGNFVRIKADDLNVYYLNYSILDLAGKVLMQGQVNNNRIAISELDRGTYFVQIIVGESITTKKLVVK